MEEFEQLSSTKTLFKSQVVERSAALARHPDPGIVDMPPILKKALLG